MKENNLPEFQVEICHPENKYDISPIRDKILTLEGNNAGLPYGSTSGKWGDSGSGWTEQHGTPIGADITYFSRYEDSFYRLNINFPEDKIKDYMERAYAEGDDPHQETQEYKNLGRGYKSGGDKVYNSFSTLVFGFAPKGMVVVWLRFGPFIQIELGRYQSKIIRDDKELENIFFSKLSVTRRELKEKRYIDVSPVLWDNYRKKFVWEPLASSDNKGFQLLQILSSYYNGEQENMLRPWVSHPSVKERAIPNMIKVFWQTGKKANQRRMSEIYLDWQETERILQESPGNKTLHIKVSEDNSSINLLINEHPLKADSIRIFPWSTRWEENYTNID